MPPAPSCWPQWLSLAASLLWVLPLQASLLVACFLFPKRRMLNYNIGSVAATVQSIVYGGVTGGLFALLQSAGASMVLPSVGTIFAGAATTGAGIGMMKNSESITSRILSDSIAPDSQLGEDGGGNASSTPPYNLTNPHEYLLTPRAVQAIVKSWDISLYNPPWTDVADWLSRLREFCGVYGVPVTQWALCAVHLMRADCRKAANVAGCHDMTWDQFTAWLLKYDGMRIISKALFLDTYTTTRGK